MPRTIHHHYRDPLDLVWLRCAQRVGMKLAIDPSVYASWDGRDTLNVCPPSQYDPDDSLAQLIFHEVCHALVQGPDNRRRVDWGLDNVNEADDAVREYACHRLQAALLDRYGLRGLLAVTTDWRPYWDALPADPLGDGDDPAIPIARDAWPDAVRGPWSAAIDDALRATADLADVIRPIAPADSLWSRTVPRTPVGRAALVPAGATCASCTWLDDASSTCRAVGPTGSAVPVSTGWPACVSWEARLGQHDCAACGACCHRGFGAVEVLPTDTLAAVRPELLVDDGGFVHLPRPGGRCVGLATSTAPWRCAVYAIRPTSCRDFEVGGDACLEARRRTGRSRL